MSKILSTYYPLGFSIFTCALAYDSGNIPADSKFFMMACATLLVSLCLIRMMQGAPVDIGEDEVRIITPEDNPRDYKEFGALYVVFYIFLNFVMVSIYTGEISKTNHNTTHKPTHVRTTVDNSHKEIGASSGKYFENSEHPIL
jgi:hypothetical protein